MIKKLTLWLCVFLIPFCLGSCKGPYSDSEASELLVELLEKDAALNHYIWGDGFGTLTDPGEDAEKTSCTYYRVNADAPYHSVEELKQAMAEIYSEELYAIVAAYAVENTENSMARFCDFYQNEQVADLQVDVTMNHPPYELNTVIYPSTAKVSRSSATIIEAEVEYTVGTNQERQTMKIRILKENGAWKLDSQTWAGAVGE